MMHVIDVLLDSFTRLFRHHRYSPLEKLYSVILFIEGLSLKGYLREVLSDICFKGIGENMGSQVLIFVQAIKEDQEASGSR
jgi:hypothetical protein